MCACEQTWGRGLVSRLHTLVLAFPGIVIYFGEAQFTAVCSCRVVGSRIVWRCRGLSATSVLAMSCVLQMPADAGLSSFKSMAVAQSKYNGIMKSFRTGNPAGVTAANEARVAKLVSDIDSDIQGIKVSGYLGLERASAMVQRLQVQHILCCLHRAAVSYRCN